jgi:hypothetical protein
MKLDEHVRNTVKSRQGILDLDDEMEGVVKTWERRLEGEYGGGVVQLLDPAYIAAYIMDPLYAVASPSGMALAMVPLTHEDQAKKLVKHVNGSKALQQFSTFLVSGWTGGMQDIAAACPERSDTSQALTGGHKRGSPKRWRLFACARGFGSAMGKQISLNSQKWCCA